MVLKCKIYKFYLKAITFLIHNGNWTEWSAIWSEIMRVISKSKSAQREFDLKSQVWFQTKIVRHEVQFNTSLLHLFWNHIVFFIHFRKPGFFWKEAIGGTEIAKFPSNDFFLPYIFFAIWLVVQESHEIWFAIIITYSLWRAKTRIEQKMVRFVNKLHCWELIRSQGSPVNSKWV